MNEFDQFKETLGSPDSAPKRALGVDLSQQRLSSQEGFVLSRVDGSTSLRDLCVLSGLGVSMTLEILASLCKAGLVEASGVVSQGPPQRPVAPSAQSAPVSSGKPASSSPSDDSEEKAWESFEFDHELLHSVSDLSERKRKQILYSYQRLDEITYYDLLGVEPEVDAEQIRRAYYRATKRYHPDRYFRRDLGPFREILGLMFKRLSHAYDVLSSPPTRAEYDKLIAHALQSRRDASEAQLAQRKRALRVYEVALTKFQAGMLEAAQEDLREALELDPENMQYQEMLRRISGSVGGASTTTPGSQPADEAVQRGVAAQQAGDLLGAADAFVEAAEKQASGENLKRAVEAMLVTGGDQAKMLRFAELAVKSSPNDPGYLKTLALVHERRGSAGEAVKYLKEAARRAPDDASIQKKLNVLTEVSVGSDS